MKPMIPTRLAMNFRAEGLDWKQVARELKKRGYPPGDFLPFQAESIAMACTRDGLYKRVGKTAVEKPVELIRAMRAEGTPWKVIGEQLHSMGYPLWHYSTLANVLAGRHK